jgi:hypothetical protein
MVFLTPLPGPWNRVTYLRRVRAMRKMTKRYVLALSLLVLLITNHFLDVCNTVTTLSNLYRGHNSTQCPYSFACWWVRDVVDCSDCI